MEDIQEHVEKVTFVSPHKNYRIVLRSTIKTVVNGQVLVTPHKTVIFENGQISVSKATAKEMISTPYFNNRFFYCSEKQKHVKAMAPRETSDVKLKTADSSKEPDHTPLKSVITEGPASTAEKQDLMQKIDQLK